MPVAFRAPDVDILLKKVVSGVPGLRELFRIPGRGHNQNAFEVSIRNKGGSTLPDKGMIESPFLLNPKNLSNKKQRSKSNRIERPTGIRG
ncbi:hypothetical protein [Desulfoluna butyratoxydans]|uniref:hypothetical protein n=1 Tax=Desulfoluna butyratoxydans TaxID=231438 RepID=UPI0015D26213|nr:hypothetical protein [Desulfoluna butyratoxydans]